MENMENIYNAEVEGYEVNDIPEEDSNGSGSDAIGRVVAAVVGGAVTLVTVKAVPKIKAAMAKRKAEREVQKKALERYREVEAKKAEADAPAVSE